MTGLFLVAYVAPPLGMACQAAVVVALRRRPARATGWMRAALSLGMGTALLWAGLAASDGMQASTLGVAVVAYFLPSAPLGAGVFATVAGAVSPLARLALPPGKPVERLPVHGALALTLGAALLLAPFLLGKLAMGWDAAALR